MGWEELEILMHECLQAVSEAKVEWHCQNWSDIEFAFVIQAELLTWLSWIAFVIQAELIDMVSP
jgi:hypothetical protein